MLVDYPVLFLFEVGQWWDYAMAVVVTIALMLTAWWLQRSKVAVIAILIVLPLALTCFWWPWSTQGTNSAGWFPIVKQYSALLGSLSLVALQYFPRLTRLKWYLTIPALILFVNIMEAVIRDFQCYFIHGVDPSQGLWTWGGPWNLMNGIAGILNALMISGWVGIFVSKGKEKAIVWLDLTIPWIIAYDIWNFAYVYNCLADRAWYSGLVLLASCTIPAFMRIGKGAWLQYRAYTLTLWSGVVLTFPHFMHDSMFAHRASHSPTAMFTISLLALIVNIVVFIWHFYRVLKLGRNPFTQQVHADLPSSQELINRYASPDEIVRIKQRDL